jgi:N-formylglutamate amidohydrolase
MLSIPHSGREYPDWLIDRSLAGRDALESLADPLVDRLAWRAMSAGHGMVISRTPRAALDCNRAPDDIDPAIIDSFTLANPTVRAKSGLGVIPDRTALHGRIWRERLTRTELKKRLEEAHVPYHRGIEKMLDLLVIEHSHVLLLDCHSMPWRRGQADLVIGDRYGRSAAPWLTAEAARVARSHGWTVAINQPYAGGYIIDHHGQPDSGRHALQLEICRSAYLCTNASSPGPGFDRSARLIETLARELGRALLETRAIAAE